MKGFFRCSALQKAVSSQHLSDDVRDQRLIFKDENGLHSTPFHTRAAEKIRALYQRIMSAERANLREILRIVLCNNTCAGVILLKQGFGGLTKDADVT